MDIIHARPGISLIILEFFSQGGQATTCLFLSNPSAITLYFLVIDKNHKKNVLGYKKVI
jgi:hypothetical protein